MASTTSSSVNSILPFAALLTWLVGLRETLRHTIPHSFASSYVQHFLAAIWNTISAKFLRRDEVCITSFPLLTLPQDVVLQIMGFLASSDVAARTAGSCEMPIKEKTARLLLHRALLSNVCKAWHAQLQADDASDNSWFRTIFIRPKSVSRSIRQKSSDVSHWESESDDEDDDEDKEEESDRVDICVTWLLIALPSLVYAARQPKEEICDALRIILDRATRRHKQPRIVDPDDDDEAAGDAEEITLHIHKICCFMWSCLTSPSLRRDQRHAVKVVGAWASLLKCKLPAARLATTPMSVCLLTILLHAMQATEDDRRAFYYTPISDEGAAETHDSNLTIWGGNPPTLRKLCTSLLELMAQELGPDAVIERTFPSIECRIIRPMAHGIRGTSVVDIREAALLALGVVATSCGERLASRREVVLGEWIAPFLEDEDEMTRCTAFWTLGRVVEGLFDTGALDEGMRRQVFGQVLDWFDKGLSDGGNKAVMAAANALGESFGALDFPLALQFKDPLLGMALRAIRRTPQLPGPYEVLNKVVEVVGWAMWERSEGESLRLAMDTVVGAWGEVTGDTHGQPERHPMETLMALWREVMSPVGGKEERRITILTAGDREDVMDTAWSASAIKTTMAVNRREAMQTMWEKDHGSIGGKTTTTTTSTTTTTTTTTTSSITITITASKHQAIILEGPWIPHILALTRQALQSNLCLSTPLGTEVVAACLNLFCAFLELTGGDATTLFSVHAPRLVNECLLPLLSQTDTLPSIVAIPLHALLGEAIPLYPSLFTSSLHGWASGLVHTIVNTPLTLSHPRRARYGDSSAPESSFSPFSSSFSSSSSSSSVDLPSTTAGAPHSLNLINNAVYAFGQLALATYTPSYLPLSSSPSSSPLLPHIPSVIKALGRILKMGSMQRKYRGEDEDEGGNEDEDDDPMAILELLSGGRRDEEAYLRVTCACTLGALALHSPALVHEWLLASRERQQARRARRRERGGHRLRRRGQRDEGKEEEEEEDLASRWYGLVVGSPKLLRGNLNRAELWYGVAGLTTVLAFDAEEGELKLLSSSSFKQTSSPTGAGEEEGRDRGVDLLVLVKALVSLEENITETEVPAFSSLPPTLTRDTAQRLRHIL